MTREEFLDIVYSELHSEQEILGCLDDVLHPILTPDTWDAYVELHEMIVELPFE